MCGICGIMNDDPGRPVSVPVLEVMSRTLDHRGPDDRGHMVDGRTGIASTRLAIIDIEGGRQPIQNEDRSLAIVLNGEIYNYADLTRMLLRRGHSFRTRSDTEAVLHAYEEFGPECLDYLNGMFAFAIWDAHQQRLVLARDRTGIKPLYYAVHDQALIFGSELKAILSYPGFPRAIDLGSLHEYLSYEYVPTPRSIFKYVRKLPPGHALQRQDGQTQIWRYWDINLADSERIQRRPPGDYAAELREVLGQVVRTETVSDVPVGVLLSGGVDSSTVAALLCRASSQRPKSFSITFEDTSFDESRYARLAARHLGTEHHEATLTPEVALSVMPRIAALVDEPLGDSSLVPTYLLSQLARQHVKVVMGGDGGDELFGGYSTLQAHRLVEYYERFLPSVVRQRIIPQLVGLLPTSFNNISTDFKLRRFLGARGVALAVRHHQWMGSFRPAEMRELLLDEGVLRERDSYASVYRCLAECSAEERVNQLLYCDMKLYLEGGMLPKVDRASMANSLEVRVPLLNHLLIRCVSRIPHQFKLRRFTTKYILRRAAQGLLPPVILRRGKKGFNMPVAKWLTGPLRPLAEEYLSEERLRREGFFNPAYVRRLLDDHLAQRCDHRKLLWTLLAFEMWCERWSGSSS